MRKNSNRNRKSDDEAQLSPPPQGKLSSLFDIPPSALSGTAQIELAGNREALVEGCKGVLEYDETVVKLATEGMSVKFTGRGLQIKVLTHDSAVVTGYILGVEFVT